MIAITAKDARVEHEQRDRQRDDGKHAHRHLDRVHRDGAALSEEDALQELRGEGRRNAGDRDQQLRPAQALRHAGRDEPHEHARRHAGGAEDDGQP